LYIGGRQFSSVQFSSVQCSCMIPTRLAGTHGCGCESLALSHLSFPYRVPVCPVTAAGKEGAGMGWCTYVQVLACIVVLLTSTTATIQKVQQYHDCCCCSSKKKTTPTYWVLLLQYNQHPSYRPREVSTAAHHISGSGSSAGTFRDTV